MGKKKKTECYVGQHTHGPFAYICIGHALHVDCFVYAFIIISTTLPQSAMNFFSSFLVPLSLAGLAMVAHRLESGMFVSLLYLLYLTNSFFISICYNDLDDNKLTLVEEWGSNGDKFCLSPWYTRQSRLHVPNGSHDTRTNDTPQTSRHIQTGQQ
jgi:hypothetical protein